MPTGKALITGISGQDGSYLSEFLLSRDYEVHGTSRSAEHTDFYGLKHLDIDNQVERHSVNLSSPEDVTGLLEALQPTEIYHLAGQSSVGQSFEDPVGSIESVTASTLNILEFMRKTGAKTKFFFAASSECFGSTTEPVDIGSPLCPHSPYALAKANGLLSVAQYREAYDLFSCSGVLFNHESPLRPKHFVSKKIVSTAVQIASGEPKKLKLGNLSIRRDWGWAPDYIEAMWMMLQRDTPDDFVIATGKTISLEDFVATVFSSLGLDWGDHVEYDPEFDRPNELHQSLAHTERTSRELGWTAQTDIEQTVERLVDFEKERVGVLENLK